MNVWIVMREKYMRRRLAAAAAVTSAFVLLVGTVGMTGVATANPPDPVQLTDGEPELWAGNPSCESLGLEPLLKVEGANNGENESGTISGVVSDGMTLDVTVTDVTDVTVIVKGGTNSNVYRSTLTGLVAPLNDGGQQAQISHWEVCAGEEAPPPSPSESPSESPTVQPTASESPAVVPTAVPAGADNGGGNGSAGLMGLVLAGGVAVAGAAAAVRRRTRHGA